MRRERFGDARPEHRLCEWHLGRKLREVRDSDPAAELAETEIKLGALLPVRSG